MKIQLNREAMIKELQLSVSLLDSSMQPENPMKRAVLMRVAEGKLTLTATDGALTLRSFISDLRVDVEGEICVVGPDLFNIMRSLPTESTMDFELLPADQDAANTPGYLKVTTTGSEHQIACFSAQNFASFTENADTEATQLHAKTFAAMVKYVSHAISQKDVRLYLMGMLLEMESADGKNLIRCVATDSHRLAVAHMQTDADVSEGRILVPRKAVDTMLKLLEEGGEADEELSLKRSTDYVCVSYRQYELFSRLISASFPDYQSVIPSGESCDISVKCKDFREALNRATVLSSARDAFPRVRLKGTDNNEMTLSDTPHSGEYARTVVQIEGAAGPFDVSFNAVYLKDVLSLNKSDVIKLRIYSADRGARLEAPGTAADVADYFTIVMPLRV